MVTLPEITSERVMIVLFILAAIGGLAAQQRWIPNGCDRPNVVCQGHFVGVYPK